MSDETTRPETDDHEADQPLPTTDDGVLEVLEQQPDDAVAVAPEEAALEVQGSQPRPYEQGDRQDGLA